MSRTVLHTKGTRGTGLGLAMVYAWRSDMAPVSKSRVSLAKARSYA